MTIQPTFEWYELTVSGKREACRTVFSPKTGTAMKKDFRKLYVVMAEAEEQPVCWYVGEAETDIKTRFQRGFTSYRSFCKHGKAIKGYSGYKGYKWIEFADETRPLQVLTVTIPVGGIERQAVEAIEGEVVHLVRSRTGQWPLYQNEIHFSNSSDSLNAVEIQEIAVAIFNEAFDLSDRKCGQSQP